MKGQTSTEYLMTYGWAFLVIVVVGSVFYSLGLLNTTTYVKETVISLKYFSYIDQQLTSETYIINLRNSINEITITGIRLGSADIDTLPYMSVSQPIKPGESFTIATSSVPANLVEGNNYELDLEIIYDVSGGINGNKDTGNIIVRVTEPSSLSNINVCQLADDNELCDGLDIAYGEGYKDSCCSEHVSCC